MSTRENKIRYKIIFDHPQYVIVNKPAGMLSVPERFTDKVSLRKLLNDRYGRIYAVHRLDQFTSGIILFAKNKESHRTWNKLFEKRKINKENTRCTDRINTPPELYSLPKIKKVTEPRTNYLKNEKSPKNIWRSHPGYFRKNPTS